MKRGLFIILFVVALLFISGEQGCFVGTEPLINKIFIGSPNSCCKLSSGANTSCISDISQLECDNLYTNYGNYYTQEIYQNGLANSCSNVFGCSKRMVCNFEGKIYSEGQEECYENKLYKCVDGNFNLVENYIINTFLDNSNEKILEFIHTNQAVTIYLKIPKCVQLNDINFYLTELTDFNSEEMVSYYGDVAGPRNLFFIVGEPFDPYKIDFELIGLVNTGITPNFAQYINEYLSNCNIDSEGNCLVPISIHSSSIGKIKISFEPQRTYNVAFIIANRSNTIITDISSYVNFLNKTKNRFPYIFLESTKYKILLNTTENIFLTNIPKDPWNQQYDCFESCTQSSDCESNYVCKYGVCCENNILITNWEDQALYNFYKSHGDNYDFIFIINTDPSGGAVGNQFTFFDSRSYGWNIFKLKHIAIVRLSPDDSNILIENLDSLNYYMLHELGHYWSVWLDYPISEGIIKENYEYNINPHHPQILNGTNIMGVYSSWVSTNNHNNIYINLLLKYKPELFNYKYIDIIREIPTLDFNSLTEDEKLIVSKFIKEKREGVFNDFDLFEMGVVDRNKVTPILYIEKDTAKWATINDVAPINNLTKGFDTDFDGIPNWVETQGENGYTTDYLDYDTDGDSWSDMDEIYTYNTNPLDNQDHPNGIKNYFPFIVRLEIEPKIPKIGENVRISSLSFDYEGLKIVEYILRGEIIESCNFFGERRGACVLDYTFDSVDSFTITIKITDLNDQTYLEDISLVVI